MIRIGVIGTGGVGKAFLKLLNSKKELLSNQGLCFTVNYIMNSKIGIYEESGIDINRFFSSFGSNPGINDYYKNMKFDDLLHNHGIDMLVEMTPTNKKTGEPGMTYIKNALENGINVVTSNKGPILLAYRDLIELAKKNGVQLGIGCTAGGALPAINGGLPDMAGSRISSIEGVLNGTTNFILDEMENKNITYTEALSEAQRLGIAESDPSMDVEGWDTAIKLLILTNVIMDEDKTLKDVAVCGITHITAKDIQKALHENKRFKLIGRARKNENGTHIKVSLEKVGQDNPLYFVGGKNKAVKYVSDTLGELTMIGGQSGTTAAAASILRDIVNIHRGYRFF